MTDKEFNATVQGQKQMCYNAGHNATKKMLSDFIDKRHKERFQLVKQWRSKLITWDVVEKFDKVTDKQESILDSML